jgi:hypothetical protein
MRRAFLLLLGVVAATWLQYECFPGHTYLEGETQIYLPILERLDSPGFLSRDLVATHPNVAYTIYDELTLFLHELGHLDFRTALTAQQLLCRAAAIVGIFLLALSAGLSDLSAFLAATVVNLGATLIGPCVMVVGREATPQTFAFGLTFLAAGLIAREKPLLAGLAGGLAVVYDPTLAGPFWSVIIAAFMFDAQLRRLLRPALTILVVFVLLLANLAQLQPGIVESQHFFTKISEPFARLQQYRTSFVWVSLWAPTEIWHYLAILVLDVWATARIWTALKRQARWLFAGLPLCGIIGVLLSDVLLDHLQWAIIPRIQPARALLFTVGFTSVACAIAGLRATGMRKYREGCLWFLAVFAIPMNVRVLDLLNVGNRAHSLQLGVAAILAGTSVFLMRQLRETRWKALVLLVPLGAAFAMQGVDRFQSSRKPDQRPILEVAHWAEKNTWGSSMFLFPDAGRQVYPGIFRAESRRALWVDWNSGVLVPYFESFAAEWWPRWQETMEQGFSPQRLENMLSLPIDYYVLKSANQLANLRPVFRNEEFVVYDSGDLRNAKLPLRVAGSRAGS